MSRVKEALMPEDYYEFEGAPSNRKLYMRINRGDIMEVFEANSAYHARHLMKGRSGVIAIVLGDTPEIAIKTHFPDQWNNPLIREF